jgi:DNA polymerase III delta prime subunit
MRARPDLARPALRARLLERVRQGPPLLLTGPPGSGKTTLLREVAAVLAAEGWAVVQLDLMGGASAPERLVHAALRALPAEAFGEHLPRATEIRRLAEAGKEKGAAAVQALLGFWASLERAAGRPVALLLDEATEIRSLAYFAGLRQVDRPFAQALNSRSRGTLLATSYPSLARRLWPSWETMEAAPLTPSEIADALATHGLRADPAALAAASFGWPRYLRPLLDGLSLGAGLLEVWVEEMSEGGRLDAACRHTYESLLLRSRGYGMSKAVLAAVAAEEGLNLTALVGRLGRTPGATRVYLGWLLGVDALRMVKKRYHYVDGLLRHWVRLHARGVPARPAEILDAARTALGGPPSSLPPERAAAPPPPAPRDNLMEID